MKNALVILACSLTLFSCERWKRVSTEVTEKHYYHDTTLVSRTETIKPVFIPADSTNAVFELKRLIEAGELSHTDRQFTTRIIYRDGNLNVSTTVDSLMLLLREIQEEQLRIKVSGSETKTKVVDEKKPQRYWPWLLVAFVVSVLFFFAFRTWTRVS